MEPKCVLIVAGKGDADDNAYKLIHGCYNITRDGASFR